MPVQITGGSFRNNGKDGIHVEGDHELTIEGVNVEGNGEHGISIKPFDPEQLDSETKQLLDELRDALLQKDKGLVKKIFNTLADKSLDLVIALLAGLILKGVK